MHPSFQQASESHLAITHGSITPAAVTRFLGITLFLISFPVPDADLTEDGIIWNNQGLGGSFFLWTPILVALLMAQCDEWRILFLLIALGAGWFTNFTVFFQFPRELAWIPMLTPWSLLIAVLLWDPSGGDLLGFLPFWIWATGILLAHGAVYLPPRKPYNWWQ